MNDSVPRFAAAQSDPVLADVADSLNEQRCETVRALADAVPGEASPPEDVTRSDLVYNVYATGPAPMYRQAVKERGWTTEKHIV